MMRLTIALSVAQLATPAIAIDIYSGGAAPPEVYSGVIHPVDEIYEGLQMAAQYQPDE